MKKLIIISLMLTLAACKGASTAAPRGSADEIAAERQQQAQIAKNGTTEAPKQKVPLTNSLKDKYLKVAQKVAPAGQALCQQIGKSDCKYSFKIEEASDLNAYADGNNIVVSTAMLDFANETELASVVSHEYAHNIMGHVASQTQNAAVGGILGMIVDQVAASQGIQTGGAAGKLGANYSVMKYSVAFEQEADYVGLYVMDKAGYDINAAPGFWRKMSAADSRGITMRTTHPTNPERYVALNHTIQEIESKKKSGLPVVPEFKKK
jgi:predicted Zn-dependent protease